MIKPLKATRRRADAPSQLGDLSILKYFLPTQQVKVLEVLLRGEEGKFFAVTLNELAERIKNMPSAENPQNSDDPTVYLHYFRGDSHWFITEKDSTVEQVQAFGWAILNGDLQNAELGYVPICELLTFSGVEIDLHWAPKTLSEAKMSKGFHRR